MKWTQVLATGFSAVGLFASTTYGSVLPYESASSAVIVEDVQDITNRSADLQKVVSGISSSTLFQNGKVRMVVTLPDFSIILPPGNYRRARRHCDGLDEEFAELETLYRLRMREGSALHGSS